MTLPPNTSTPTLPNASPALAPAEPMSAWAPLRIVVFRWLWIATLVSQIGTWAQEAGGPWLMHELMPNPARAAMMVALVAMAENLPICLLSLPGGALADVLDRRKLLIFSQIWMLVASGLLGIITLLGYASPAILLLFTFLLGIGIALSGPAFQAIVPELVPPGDMPLAVALNSVALNVARAIGPALGMVVVLLAGSGTRGPGASFLLNAVTFVGVAWVLYEWRRPTKGGPANTERIWGAVQLGLRYTRYSPALRAVLLRVFAFIFFAVAMWAQIPTIAAQQLHMAEGGYGMLMGCLGAGAVVGVIVMPRLQRRLQIDKMVTYCTAGYALGLLALSAVHRGWLAFPIMLFIGFNWVVVPTNFNVATQKSVPNWVKARALSMYLTTLFGTWTLSAIFWGWVTKNSSIGWALFLASVGLGLGLLLTKRFRLTHAAGHDLTPAFKGPAATPAPPVSLGDLATCPGVRVRTRYAVSHDRANDFTAATHDLRLQRLRNGAHAWSLHRAPTGSGHFIETFDFHSTGEWLRFHGRTTMQDLAFQQGLGAYSPAGVVPQIEHERYAGPPGVISRESLVSHGVRIVDRILEECENAIERLNSSKLSR